MKFKRLLQSCSILAALCLAPGAQAASTILQAPDAQTIAFEAENSVLNNPAGADETWVVISDNTASGKKTLRATGVNNTGTAPHSFAYYKIKFATEGSYYVYTRWMTDPTVNATDAFTGNSYWVANKLGELNTTGAAGQADYVRSAANDVSSSGNGAFLWTKEASPLINVTAAEIAAGPQTFTIGTREMGMLIDRMVLSTDGTLTTAQLDALLNTDTTTVTQGANDTYVAWEAETKAKVINPTGAKEFWQPITDNTASGKGALRIEGTNDTGTAPHSFLQFQLQFATEGTYYYYSRWMADPARNATDAFTANSYLIANAFGALSTQGDAASYTRSAANDVSSSGNGAFLWTKEADTLAYTVTPNEITNGPVTLTIGTREAGFTLDRIVVSTQNNLTPAQLDALLNSGTRGAPPELASARGSGPLNKVILTFTRPIDAATVQATDFSISPSLQVTAAAVNAEDPRVVELTTATQPQATRYTVTASGISDTSGTPIASVNNQKQFSSLKLVNGWVTREIFRGITGSTVQNLLDDPKFAADLPTTVDWVRGFDYGENPQAGDLGVRMTALLNPTVSGGYNIYTINDDQLQVDVSPNASVDGLQFVALNALAGAYNPEVYGATPDLVANQPALIRTLLKQGGGAVALSVAAKPSSDTTTPVDSNLTLSGNRISTYVDPDAGVVTFVQQPAPATATVGSRATFSVKVTAPTSGPIYYQWQENGVNIPGAIRNTYITDPLTTAKSGKSYRVIVSVAGTDTASQAATLTVNDGVAPAQQPYIGVNFFGGGDRGGLNLLPADVAGAVPQNNWNNLAGNSFADTVLTDASGAATPVTLTTSGTTEQWYSGASVVGDGNARLMQGFISAGATAVGTPVTFTFNNVPAGNYSVLAYTVGFDFQADYRQSYMVTGTADSAVVHGKGETGTAYIANPAFRKMTGGTTASPVSGNYAQIDSVSPDANGTLTLTVITEADNIGGSHQPAINGIQLVKIVPQQARPSIGLTRNGNNVTLSWTADAAGFHFETTSSLTPGTAWVTVPGVPNPITTAGQVNTTVPTTGMGFYRLVK